MTASSLALRGIVLAIISYVIIALADTLSKQVQEHVSVSQVILIRQLFQFAFMGMLWWIFYARKQRFIIPPVKSLQFVRNVIMIVVIAMYISSLNVLDIAVAISLLSTAPFFTLPFAFLLLKERAGIKNILTIGVGFCGVIMIVQPGFEQFHPAMLVVLASAAIIGLYMVLARKLADDMHPINFLCYQGAVVAVPYVILSALFWQPIPAELWWPLLFLSALSACFHLCFLTAVRYLEANFIAPIMYVEVASGLLFGYLFFDNIPNVLSLAGIAVITTAGVFLTLGKTQLFKRRSAPH